MIPGLWRTGDRDMDPRLNGPLCNFGMNFIKSMYHGERVYDEGLKIYLDQPLFTQEEQGESLGAVGW